MIKLFRPIDQSDTTAVCFMSIAFLKRRHLAHEGLGIVVKLTKP